MIRQVTAICLGLGLAVAVPSTTTAQESIQDEVLNCLAEVETSTEWNACLKVMFAPCAMEDFGSSGHVACLTSERTDWQEAKTSAEARAAEALSEDGVKELDGLMLAWPHFVNDKCTALAERRSDISQGAAMLGCQIAEYALLINELTACAEGRSSEPYCQTKTE